MLDSTDPTVILIYENKRDTEPRRVLIIEDRKLAREWIGYCFDAKLPFIITALTEVVTESPPVIEKQNKLL